MADDRRGPGGGDAAGVAEAPAPRKGRGGPIESVDLLAGRTEIEIAHEDQIYRLRRTSNNQLILTK